MPKKETAETPKLIAHRGFSAVAPENTLLAYTLAHEQGFGYAECDVSWTKDGIPVLLHDDSIDRTSDGQGLVESLTLEEARLYDYGGWKDPAYAATELPTFQEFVALCRRLALHPYIELKGSIKKEQAELLIKMVAEQDMLDRVTWISFSKSSLEEILANDEKARLGYLGRLWPEFLTSAKSLATSSPHLFLDVADYELTPEIIREALTLGFPLEVWTVNSAERAKELLAYGVTGITTDCLTNRCLAGNAIT